MRQIVLVFCSAGNYKLIGGFTYLTKQCLSEQWENLVPGLLALVL